MGRLVEYLIHLKHNPFIKNKEIEKDILDAVSSKAYYERSDSPFDNWTETRNKATADFTYVPYVPKNISRTRLYADNDLLSTNFSGCYLARYENGCYRYGCHIATSTQENYDRKEDWMKFIALNQYKNSIIFQPFIPTFINKGRELYCMGSPVKFSGGIQVWGIISTTKICYTAIVGIDCKKNITFLMDIFQTPSRNFQDPFPS